MRQEGDGKFFWLFITLSRLHIRLVFCLKVNPIHFVVLLGVMSRLSFVEISLLSTNTITHLLDAMGYMYNWDFLRNYSNCSY